jgi:Flp pilus assembly pilin Flp
MGNRVVSGHSLSEYGLLLALIAVVCLGGLRLVGNSVSHLVGNVIAGLDEGAGTPGNGPGWGLGGLALTGPAATADDAVGGVSGEQAALGRAPANGLSTDTAAVDAAINGGKNATSVDGVQMVHDQADALQAMARQIQADPNHDPEVLALVTQLANSGHTAADKLAAGIVPYQQAIQNGEKDDVLTSANILAAADAGKTFNTTAQQFQDYMQAHPQALSSTMANAVQAASQDISTVVSPLSNPNPKSADDSDQINAAAWNALASQSLQVHTDANTSCANGGDANSCVH